MVEHPKLQSAGGCNQPDVSPCSDRRLSPHPHPGVDEEDRPGLVDVVVDDGHAEADLDGLAVVDPRVRQLVVGVGPIEEVLTEQLPVRLEAATGRGCAGDANAGNTNARGHVCKRSAR